MKAIPYESDAIERYFRTHRVTWGDFYPSERIMLERLSPGAGTSVLDIGCGCGGLGLALSERFGVVDYTGIEINARAAATASDLNPRARIHTGDFLSIDAGTLRREGYDLVASLSCIDWNVGFDEALDAAYALVKPGGHLLLSLRLTSGDTVNDVTRSYQYINYEGVRNGEIAAYVVLNGRELLDRVLAFRPERIAGYGRWGTPSPTAVTPCERLCFSVLTVQKPMIEPPLDARLELDLPADLLATPDLG